MNYRRPNTPDWLVRVLAWMVAIGVVGGLIKHWLE